MHNLTRLFSILLFSFLLIPVSGSVLAQDDIDDVINNLDADFQFGSKEDIKQTNLNNTNEQNREDIKISEQENQEEEEEQPQVLLIDITVDITEAAGGTTKVEVVGGSTLASGLSLSTVTQTLQFPAGSTQTLKVSCSVGPSCDTWIFFIKGAQFVSNMQPGLLESSSSGQMSTLQILVNQDNNGPTNVNPGPPV